MLMIVIVTLAADVGAGQGLDLTRGPEDEGILAHAAEAVAEEHGLALEGLRLDLLADLDLHAGTGLLLVGHDQRKDQVGQNPGL